MSALDDALERARRAAPIDQSQTAQGRTDGADRILADVCQDAVATLRKLGIQPLDVYTQRTSEWSTYPVVHEGKAWALQVFLVTEGGVPYTKPWVIHGSSKYDASGRDHIHAGDELDRPISTGHGDPLAIDQDGRPVVRRWPPEERWHTSLYFSPTMQVRFPEPMGDKPIDYPLEDVLAFAILELSESK